MGDDTPPAGDDPLVAALVAVVGDEHVLVDEGQRASFETDWTGRWSGLARCVVRPADTEEVAAVVATCAEHRAAVVPQGGNTSLVGGSVPRGGEVVVSLTRLDVLGPVDRAARQVTVGAGATLAAVQRHAGAAGLAYGVDLAARDTATIGGTIATDAGGIRVVRHGATRAQVVGLEAVLADGGVVTRLGGVVADGVGYDLCSLLVGSEGTLAIVTRARLALTSLPEPGALALVAVSDVAAALAVEAAVGGACGGVEASELVTGSGLDLVAEVTGARLPFGATPRYAVLLEVGGGTAAAELLGGAIERALDEIPGVEDAVLGLDAADRTRLWHLREAHTEAIATRAGVVKLDVALPRSELAGFLDSLAGLVAAESPAVEVVVFGHLGVGDLHVNLLGVPSEAVAACEDAVLGEVVARGGAPCGEHGVGVHKRRWVTRARGERDVAAMRAIRRALDPDELLNPGVLLPDED
ncbi:MAG: FAD-binding oxidoreductase [Nitriliruptoraceae bacterium]